MCQQYVVELHRQNVLNRAYNNDVLLDTLSEVGIQLQTHESNRTLVCSVVKEYMTMFVSSVRLTQLATVSDSVV